MAAVMVIINSAKKPQWMLKLGGVVIWWRIRYLPRCKVFADKVVIRYKKKKKKKLHSGCTQLCNTLMKLLSKLLSPIME